MCTSHAVVREMDDCLSEVPLRPLAVIILTLSSADNPVRHKVIYTVAHP